jgi:hypothetical protein
MADTNGDITKDIAAAINNLTIENSDLSKNETAASNIQNGIGNNSDNEDNFPKPNELNGQRMCFLCGYFTGMRIYVRKTYTYL